MRGQGDRRDVKARFRGLYVVSGRRFGIPQSRSARSATQYFGQTVRKRFALTVAMKGELSTAKKRNISDERSRSARQKPARRTATLRSNTAYLQPCSSSISYPRPNISRKRFLPRKHCAVLI